MSMFVMISENCMEEAKLHGMSDAIETLAKQIEKTQNTLMFDRFPQPYLVKKKFAGRQGRLIGSEHVVRVDGEEHKVVLLLSVMIRGDKDYDSPRGFGHDPEGYGRQKFEPIIRDYLPRLEGYIKDRTYKEPPELKPGLQGGEVSFVTEAVSTGGTTKEPSIAESRQWIERASVKVAILPRIRDLLLELREFADEGEQEADFKECSELVPQNKRLRVAYQWLDGGRVLYLHDLYEEGRTPEGAISPDRAGAAERSFYRAYPTWMLEDEELWVQLEQDRFGNFSLSPEENAILHPKDGKGLKFPLFINGRAGSGKSTILQYIYAEYLARYARVGPDAGQPPAYFACNGELIRTAISLVRSILLNNPAYSGTQSINELVADDMLFKGSFHVYHEFLMSLVPAPERCRFFPEDKYVDYARFTKLWIGKFGKTQNAYRDYGPDISWHVIRTYIKGLSTDGILEESEYQFIRKSEKTVSEQVFSRIYKSVWSAWYKDETDPDRRGNYWDDQDLVRYVLDNDLIGKSGAASLGVFCDEAQDFTHIELESFLRMSVFSERSVYPHDIDKIPFVFAGDEFQTLNPTGFKWDSVKSAFVEKFIYGICPIADEAKTTVNLVDLTNNYRSVPNIVRFGNTVQALRAAKFALTKVQPQLEWKEDVGRPVSYFSSDDESFWNALKGREDVHVIVPCHANEEVEFIRRDPVLSRHVEINLEQGTTRPPVMSTVRAKGLEYPCVVVYGFGADLGAEDGGGMFDFNDRPSDEDRTRFLSLEYFLNRLYVAVSRPRSQLYIVDTPDGRKRLWRFAESMDELRRVLTHVRRPDQWRDHVESFEDGTSKHLSASYTFNPEELAKQYETSGLSDHDPVAMNYAATYYGQCKNMKNKAKSCLALAMVFQGRLAEAAKLYREINDFEKAGDCYWRMRSEAGWREMSEMSRARSELGTKMEYSAARALTARTTQAVSHVLDAIVEKIDGGEGGLFTTPEWTAVTAELVAFVGRDHDVPDPSVLAQLLKLARAGIVPVGAEFVEKVYAAGDVDAAYELLPLAGIQKGSLFQRVMFAKSGYPACLSYYAPEGERARREDNETIVAAHAKAPDAAAKLGVPERLAVARAHLCLGRIRDVRDLVLGLNDTVAYRALAGEASIPADQRMFAGLALAAIAAKETKDVILQNINAEIDARKGSVNLLLGYIVSVLARGHQFKREATTVDLALRNSISEFLRRFAEVWRLAKLTENDKLSFVSPAEIGMALELYGHPGDAIKFYKSAYERTGNADFARRWIFLQNVQMGRTHGKSLAELRRQVEDFKRAEGITTALFSASDLISPKWEALFEALFPSDEEIARRKAKPAEPVPTTPDNTPKAEPEKPQESPAVPERQPEDGEKPAKEPEVPKSGDDGATDATGTSTDGREPENGTSEDAVPEAGDEPEPTDEPRETPTVAADAPAPRPPAEPAPARQAPAAGGVRDLGLAPDKFKLTFFSKKSRLNIENMDSGEQWNINSSGITIDGDPRGHVKSMPIEGTGFTVTTSPTFIVLHDDRCGYEFTIRL